MFKKFTILAKQLLPIFTAFYSFLHSVLPNALKWICFVPCVGLSTYKNQWGEGIPRGGTEFEKWTPIEPLGFVRPSAPSAPPNTNFWVSDPLPPPPSNTSLRRGKDGVRPQQPTNRFVIARLCLPTASSNHFSSHFRPPPPCPPASSSAFLATADLRNRGRRGLSEAAGRKPMGRCPQEAQVRRCTSVLYVEYSQKDNGKRHHASVRRRKACEAALARR